MKKISVILVAFALLLGTSISTAAVNKEKEKPSTAQELVSLLKNPRFTLQEDVNINVRFIINQDHEIVVLSVDTENDIIETFVKNRLNYEKIQNKLKVGKEYILPIKILSGS